MDDQATCTIESTGGTRRYRLAGAYPDPNSGPGPLIIAAVIFGAIAGVFGYQFLPSMLESLLHGSPADFTWWLFQVLVSPALLVFGGMLLLALAVLTFGVLISVSTDVAYLACDAGGIMRWRARNARSGFDQTVECWGFETILDVHRADRHVMLRIWSAHGGIAVTLARLPEAEADRLVACLKEDLAAAAQAWSAAGLVIHRG